LSPQAAMRLWVAAAAFLRRARLLSPQAAMRLWVAAAALREGPWRSPRCMRVYAY
jgi:hypothetical protein